MRYHELDALRAFAMLLGIVWHVTVIADVVPDDRSRAGDYALRFFIGTTHAFRLPVFFVMAGFFAGLVVARSGATAFARQRLTRIGVPLVVGVIVLVPALHAIGTWSSHAIWGGPQQSIRVGLFKPEPQHLWFLEYLLVFYALVLAARAAAARMPGTAATRMRAFRRIATSRLRLVALVPILAFIWSDQALWLNRGLDTSFVPSPGGVLFYGSFFFFGFALYRHRELIPSVRGDRGPYTLLAIAGAIALMQTHGYAAAVADVTVAWSATFALMGWFAIWFNRPNRRARYLADSSYWLYLVHFPLVGFLYFELTLLGVPAPVKLIVVPLVVVLGLLWVYEHAVRYSAVGRVLHGPRERAA